MNHSLDFLIGRIKSNSYPSEISISEWQKCEIKTFPVALAFFDKSTFPNGLTQDGNKFTFDGRDSIVEYNPNSDYDYIVARTSATDSTLAFLMEDFENCLFSVLCGLTYPKTLDLKSLGKTTFKYTVGDMLIAEKFDGNVPLRQSFIHSVALPVKFETL